MHNTCLHIYSNHKRVKSHVNIFCTTSQSDFKLVLYGFMKRTQDSDKFIFMHTHNSSKQKPGLTRINPRIKLCKHTLSYKQDKKISKRVIIHLGY